ncbi:hypothetical protein D3C57_142350 [Streptomyces rapamycinicus NRRL 5491]|uniref:Uncharacterized protein n=1 Tax=Streptomyces rapamycinicus (strain ATCC 29253 / DSM 41530 / NRRL 5491 / AYB-994) TaxID=1343740 RepID=A0A3L8R8I1_STRRN|nr:hypothetical protein D3C57_142350 [Streptomyces rapamycinicus NRRL 5491]
MGRCQCVKAGISLLGGAARAGCRVLLSCITVAALVAVLGCEKSGDGKADSAPSAPPSTQLETPEPTTSSSSEASGTTSDTDEERWCYDGVPYNPKSPPYSGKGPHSATVARVVSHDPRVQTLAPPAPNLPSGWEPHVNGDSFGKVDRSRVQLVICMFMPTAKAGEAGMNAVPVGECELTDSSDVPVTLEVVPASYDFVVYEARTGKKVDEFSLDGAASAEASCPGVTFSDGISPIGQAVKDDALAARVRSLVEDTV